MHSSDWNDLTADITWLIAEGDEVEVSPSRMACDGLFQPTAASVGAFPTLSRLLSLARVTEVKINGQLYHLYGWTDLAGRSLGWQCLPPDPTGDHRDFLSDHALLLSCFGGIRERWNEPLTWLLNLNSALTSESTRAGFNGWDEYYLDLCEDRGIQPVVDPADYRSFALEANGNCTIYHHITGQVLMFAHDHSLDHIEVLSGCPEYTLYTIKSCPNFRTWVETVAEQWLQYIKETR
jgi:hypothetical protein